MATTGAKAPTAASTTAEAPHSANAWVGAANIYGAGTASITAATFDANDQSEILRAYGFDFSAIPDGSTIDGVQVTISGAYYATAICAFDLAQLLDTGGALVGTNQYATPVNLTTSGATYTKGGATDKWGNALDAAWVKNSNFGVGIGIKVGASNNCDVYIDSVTMTVWYTAPSLNFVHQGEIYGTESVVATRTVEKVFGSSLAEERAWESTFEKGTSLIDFTHQGAIASTQSYISTKTKEGLVSSTLRAEQTLASQKTVEYHAVQGALAQTKSLASEKSVQYHTVESALSQAMTQSHSASGNIALAPSPNVTDGDPTTFQLTPPATKTTADFVAGKISDATNPIAVTITSDNYTELEWSIQVNAEKDEVFELRVTDNGTPISEAVTPSVTIGQVDFTHQGAIVATETLASDKLREKLYTGTLTAVEILQSTRAIERVWNSTMAQTDTWQGQLFRDKLFLGAIAATRTWASTRMAEHLVQGTLSQQQYLSHTRETEHLVQGALTSERTWASDASFDTAAVNFLHNGALSAEQMWASTKVRESIILGTLNANMSWASPWGKTLNFIHDSTLSAERLLTTLRTIEKVYVGSTYRTSTLSHDKYKEALIQAALAQTATWRGDRTIERVIVGGLGDVETWDSDYWKMLDYLHVGELSKEQAWASLRGIQKVIQGTLAQQKTYTSSFMKSGADTIQGTLSVGRTWSHTVSKDTRTLLIHIGNISGSRTWASVDAIEHLVVGNLSAEQFFEQYRPFSYEWDKDGTVDTVWTPRGDVPVVWGKRDGTETVWSNRAASDTTWAKRDVTSDGWDKRGKAR